MFQCLPDLLITNLWKLEQIHSTSVKTQTCHLFGFHPKTQCLDKLMDQVQAQMTNHKLTEVVIPQLNKSEESTHT